MVAGVAGLLPDIDTPLNWILASFGKTIGILQHGGLTHTPFFALVFLENHLRYYSMAD